MKIHIASDFHMEFTPTWSYQPPKADVSILAGDIAPGHAGPDFIKDMGYKNPVIVVAGNHEFYGCDYDEMKPKLWADYEGFGIRLLENEATEINVRGEEVLVLGATLWTDFRLYGDTGTSILAAQYGMNDFRQITRRDGDRLFTANDTAEINSMSVGWLDNQLKRNFGRKTVVVTHHAPSATSISPQFSGSPLNPAFVSNLEHLMLKYAPTLWVHGHVHSSHDYMIGQTRVVANPRGYPTDRFRLGLAFENTRFDPNLVVEI